MPDHIPSPVKTFGNSTTHPTHLAITKIGHGPGRPTTTFARGNKFIVVAIEYFTRWIEAKATSNNHLRNSEKVLLTKHNLQVWSTKNPNSGQWEIVRLRQIQRIQPNHGHKNSFRISLSSRVKWSGRKAQLGPQ